MTTRELQVLSLNAGSSSLKFAFWQVGAQERELWRGAAEGLGGDQARLWLRPQDANDAQAVDTRVALADVAAAVGALFELGQKQKLPAPDAIGHRVVHGGPKFTEPCLIDDARLRDIRSLVSWAPLHLPVSLDAIDAARQRYPDAAQVMCFDTAFHSALPELARRLPLPRALTDQGLRRYGFHGLSYEYVVTQLADNARGRTIVAHLGSGSSLCAIRDGRSVDTSMGFTPTGGVMMGTRPGDLDPGVVLYLQNAHGYDAHALEQLLERKSGLLGVSGSTADVKQLLERADRDTHAAEALASYCYSIQKCIGAYAAVLGGVDTLVFTGGIGERSAWVRATVCQNLGYLGVRIDAAANTQSADRISTGDSPCSVRVIATDEDRMIARHTRAVVTAPAT